MTILSGRRKGVPISTSSRGRDKSRPSQGGSEIRWRVGLFAEVLIILALWEFLVGWLGLINPSFLPPPSEIWVSLTNMIGSGNLVGNLLFSLRGLAIGLGIAIITGVVIGFAVGWFRLLRVTVAPFLWLIFSTPTVALGPIIILALGLGIWSKVALVLLLSFFPIALNTMDGVETVNGSLVRAGRVFGFNGLPLGRKVILPATFPFLLAGLQRGVALGFTGQVLGEFLGGSQGLGNILERAAYDFRMADALAIVVIILVVANVLLMLITILRKRYASWYHGDVTQL